MKQMDADLSVKIEVDYNDTDLPRTVKELKPVLWIDGDSYRCVLGPDLQSGVSGQGNTPVKALLDWDDHLRLRMKNIDPNDEVAQFAVDALKASEYDIN